MALKPDTQLGPYQILGPIGAGGMGEVYKARDTRLNRTVAVKVLPEYISRSPQAKQRFDREAKTVAALKHPNICVLHDVGSQDGIDFLVMEFLEGTTLAHRLSEGPLPLEEAMKIGLEIADALDKAHQSGIVHRDLKPGNIMLTPAGTKLLDFGLAKLGPERSGALVDVTAPPTNEPPLTADGVILGTLQYMAPEQLEGEDADARTDIFAFGTVLYEMVTRRRAFEGKSQAGLMASILSSTPPPASGLARGAPAALDHVIERCLAKDPAQRWQNARDLWMELKWATDPSRQVEKAEPRRGRILPIALAVGIVVAAAVASVLYFRSSGTVPAAESRFEIPVVGLASPFYISISPDGRRVAYLAAASSGKTALWVRPLNSLDAQLLTGTEGASTADWSPDSRFLIFAQDGKVKKMEIGGGPPQTLADLGADVQGRYTRATINRDGTIIFGVNDGKGLRRVSASGGDISVITTFDPSLEQTAHSTPWFLPDGQHFLYTAWSTKPENRAIYIGSIDGKTNKKLMQASSKALYVQPGFILFLRDRALMARPFDASHLEFTGEAIPLADGVAYNAALGQSAFYPSNEGTLIYYRSSSDSLPSGLRQWFWMDRTGKSSDPIGGVGGNATTLRLSTSGRLAGFHEQVAGNTDIWIYDLERNLRSRLTTDSAVDEFPAWSPDGEQVVFASARSGQLNELYIKPSNGAIAEQLLLKLESGVAAVPRDWSLDGQLLLFEKAVGALQGSQHDIWAFPFGGDRKPFPYLATPFTESQPALSPNGRWVAYVSNETGSANQVFIQPFPDPSKGKWQISTTGGAYPRWKRDGRELYYLDRDRRIVAVSVTTEGKFELGKSTPLFTTPIPFPSGVSVDIPYDVTADGQRFLISASLAQAPGPNTTPIAVILNWPLMLKR